MSLFRRQPQPDEFMDNDEQDNTIDPDLRLHTVRTAASTIAESIRSEQRAQRRKTTRTKRSRFFRREKRPKTAESAVSDATSAGPQVPGQRRNIYVNAPLSHSEVDQHGEPLAQYARNKVRTSTNIYFLALVIFQLFSVFGAASPSTAALPVLFILTVTAIKDAVEDYRRAQVDEEVNTSAVTKLGQWRNVNMRSDPRPWYQRLLRINQPGKISRGVQKLREKEAGDGMQVILTKRGSGDRISLSTADLNESMPSLPPLTGGGGSKLEDIQSIDSHTYPPGLHRTDEVGGWGRENPSLSRYQQSVTSRSSIGVVDWKRRTTGTAQWERTLWKKLEVGDVVLLRENEQVPADIVVLSTSDPNGLCYVETKNLDGETNLKARKALRATSSISSEEDIEKASFVLDSEPPHQNLYLTQPPGEPRREGVTINELLLRGCTVRNTAWIIGLVVFTGPDTKIYLNGGLTPSKQSKIAKETNFNVIVNFIFLVIICSLAAIISGVMDGLQATSTKIYEQGVDPTNSTVLNALVTFVSCLIAFQNIVPVSLFISIEIVKTIQAFFIAQDVDMYYKPFDAACVPKNWGISDDLGQIEYIFSDKTGTLTQNVMEFQKCSISGVVYGEGVTEAQRGAAKRQGRDDIDPEELSHKLAALKDDMVNKLVRLFKNRYAQIDKLTLISPKLAEDIADRPSQQASHIIAFFRALAVCHTVLADKPDPATKPHYLEYKAESPDEAALVAAARDVGFPFVGKSKDTIEIEVLGQPERYTLLQTLEFNSTRKRMSVIVRAPDGRIILYCKGADTVIYERLSPDVDQVLKEKTSKDMDMFANGGLRTLCIAYRVLNEDEFLSWVRTYEAASSATKNRDEEIEKAASQIEQSLLILGATALEDKLQEGVPEAIETLHRAGIKLWILTGFSCNLLKQDMEIMILSADSPDETRAQIEAGLNKISSVLGPPSWDPKKRGFVPGAQAAFAVVIDGETLRHALLPDIKPLFLNLGTQCETVKALTVKLVKEGRKAMTLSIGDGANDVAMIQEANVGCGLLGHEGSQAAMSADYAFGQFRFLTKLLLVHGRWSYQRIADMHSNFFYKNVIWTLAMFWFMPFCYFDATYLYDYSFILLYNLVFTALPVIVLGAFDQDINARAALAFPELYVRGIRGLEYTRLKFWSYMLDGLYQSAVVFFIPYLAWSLGLAVSWNGKGIDSLADLGTTVAVAAIFAANTYVGMNTHLPSLAGTFITWIVVIGSSLVMILWVVEILFSNLVFWCSVVFSVLLIGHVDSPAFHYKFVRSTYTPLDKDMSGNRGWWRLKDRLGIGHRKSTPMFREPHVRSASELTLHQTYQPTPLAPPSAKPEVDETSQDRDTLIMSSEPDLLPSVPDCSAHSLPYTPNANLSSLFRQMLPPSSSSNYSRPSYVSYTTAQSYEMQDLSHPPTWAHDSAPAGTDRPLSDAESLAGDGPYRPEEAVAPDASSDDSRTWYGGRAL
ncbi:phospholipid-translocating P-type ATPase [Pisolithus marmoratus]|nr:phospholipid-translocating P-type ATPase [Pisolithus marmoratus]